MSQKGGSTLSAWIRHMYSLVKSRLAIQADGDGVQGYKAGKHFHWWGWKGEAGGFRVDHEHEAGGGHQPCGHC